MFMKYFSAFTIHNRTKNHILPCHKYILLFMFKINYLWHRSQLFSIGLFIINPNPLVLEFWGSELPHREMFVHFQIPALTSVTSSHPVSYTHLDVYKRQTVGRVRSPKIGNWWLHMLLSCVWTGIIMKEDGNLCAEVQDISALPDLLYWQACQSSMYCLPSTGLLKNHKNRAFSIPKVRHMIFPADGWVLNFSWFFHSILLDPAQNNPFFIVC